MKITKQQLRKIIKEELADVAPSFAQGTLFAEQEEMLELLNTKFNVMEEQAPAFLRQMADDLEGKEWKSQNNSYER